MHLKNQELVKKTRSQFDCFTVTYVEVRSIIILTLDRNSARIVIIEKPVYSWKHILCAEYMNANDRVLIDTLN